METPGHQALLLGDSLIKVVVEHNFDHIDLNNIISRMLSKTSFLTWKG